MQQHSFYGLSVPGQPGASAGRDCPELWISSGCPWRPLLDTNPRPISTSAIKILAPDYRRLNENIWMSPLRILSSNWLASCWHIGVTNVHWPSFTWYLMAIYYVPGTVMGTGIQRDKETWCSSSGILSPNGAKRRYSGCITLLGLL